MRALLLPLVAVAALAACESSPSTASGAAGVTDPDDLPDTAMVRSVDPETTAGMVSGDLAAVSPSRAIQTLDLWAARLDTVSMDGADDVRRDLTTLRNLLQSSPLDGPAIGRAMVDLGEGTGALADSVGGVAGLARALRAAGGRLVPDSTVSGDGDSES